MALSPEEKQQSEIKQKKQDYIQVFSSEAGKRVKKELEQLCYFNRTPFVPNDPHGTSNNVGKQFVIVHINNWINKDIKKLIEIFNERGEQ